MRAVPAQRRAMAGRRNFRRLRKRRQEVVPKKPLDCWTCQGTEHPSWFCPTVPGTTTGPRCGICKGFGHSVASCPSEGGGKYVKPEKGKGKCKGEPDKGKGKSGIAYNTKGKGKGMSLLDEAWPGSWPRTLGRRRRQVRLSHGCSRALRRLRRGCRWSIGRRHRPRARQSGTT